MGWPIIGCGLLRVHRNELAVNNMSAILDIDLVAFERGDSSTRHAIVDGTMRSLSTGFVYVRHDIPEGLLDDAYGKLVEFFALPQERKERYKAPGTSGNIGYTELSVETAVISDIPDWKEMLNWSAPIPRGSPPSTSVPRALRRSRITG